MKVRFIANTNNRTVIVGLDARIKEGENFMSRSVFDKYITDEVKDQFSIVVLEGLEVAAAPKEKPEPATVEFDNGPGNAVQKILDDKQKTEDNLSLTTVKLTKLSAKQGSKLIEKCNDLSTLQRLKIELLGYGGFLTIKKAIDERIEILLSSKDV